ncbi:MAG: cation transporter [Erysipelotrichales bacterium]|nr:cation transporter [Erysipelotrichales bacterium]
MKTEKNILVAFILNISFSIFELIGGFFINSVAIISDAVHDFGDALSILLSLILERKSKKKPDNKYTYGYLRYSVLGALITTLILLVGSIFVIINSVKRIISPEVINYNGMIIFAIFGTIINFAAAVFTHEGDSLNQKAVNLHMLEDVLGWVVVLIGSIIMKFTDISLIDSLMSIGIALFILINAIKNVKEALDLFLEKTPNNISSDDLINHLKEISGIKDVHHLHLWSIDGNQIIATIHIICNEEDADIVKKKVREEMQEHGVNHVTIEIEKDEHDCDDLECNVSEANSSQQHHHHHH